MIPLTQGCSYCQTPPDLMFSLIVDVIDAAEVKKFKSRNQENLGL